MAYELLGMAAQIEDGKEMTLFLLGVNHRVEDTRISTIYRFTSQKDLNIYLGTNMSKEDFNSYKEGYLNE